MGRRPFRAGDAPMMRLGLFLQGGGHHIAAWRDPDVDVNGTQNLAQYIKITQMAEAACFDMVFNADTQATFGADDINVWRHTTGALRALSDRPHIRLARPDERRPLRLESRHLRGGGRGL